MNNPACHISKQRTLLLQPPLKVSPEGTRDGNTQPAPAATLLAGDGKAQDAGPRELR